MKTSRFLLLTCAAFTGLAHAAVTDQSVWHMGETGTLASSNRPIDSSNGDGAINTFSGAIGSSIGTGSAGAPNSTAYLTSNGGFYSPSPNQVIPTDNFGLEIWVRVAAADMAQSGRAVLAFGSTGNPFILTLNESGRPGWNASVWGLAYLGSAVPAVADKWTHLAIVRSGGVNSFYVDGSLVGTNTTTPANNGIMHLGVYPGGGGQIKADIDEMRLFSFNPGEFALGDLNLPIPDKFVQVGPSFSRPVANLSTAEVSEFRIGGAVADVATVTSPDGLSVVGGAGTHHTIHISQEGPVAVGTYPLIHYTGTIGGLGFDGLQLEQPIGRLNASLVNNTETSTIELKVIGAVAGSITWTGATNGFWLVDDSANWKFNETGGPTTFFAGDDVTFDDTTPINSVTLIGTVAPASVTLNNTDTAYDFSGSGISGSARFDKRGTHTVRLNNANTYSGTTTIYDGTFEIGEGGSIGSGPIGNSGRLLISTPGNTLITGVISGAGAFEKSGSGSLTLSGANTFTGELTFTGGIIKSGNISALGSTAVSTTVVSGTTLDINGVGFGSEPIILNGDGTFGQGALVNTGAAEQSGSAAYNVTLGSDASIGGSSRWDMRGSFTLTGDHKLTKVGSNEIHLVSGTVTVKDIQIDGGFLYMEYSGGINNVSPGTITINPGGAFGTADYGVPVTISKPIVINGGVLTTASTTAFGNSAIAATVTLAVENSEISPTNGATLTLNGNVNGTGSLKKGGAGKLVLGTTSYAGDTTVNLGVLSLTIPTLADASTLNVYEGVVDLNFNGVDYVAALYLSGSPQTAGLSYGGTGSGADVIDPAHFTGTGRIYVGTAPAGGYATWATNNGITGIPANIDSDNDGIANGIEFVIGGNPSGANDSAKLPTVSADADYIIFTFRRTSDANTSVSPIAEYSTNLSDWNTATNGQPALTPVVITTASGVDFTGDVVTVKVPKAITTQGKIFVRLKANIP